MVPLVVLRNLPLQTGVGWAKVGMQKATRLPQTEIEVQIEEVNPILIIGLQL